jgi:hypothetical protein
MENTERIFLRVKNLKNSLRCHKIAVKDIHERFHKQPSNY